MDFTTALVAFALITLLYLFVELGFTYAYHGFGHGWSSNRARVENPPLGRRIKNTYQNQIESAAYILPVLTAAAATGLDHQGAEIAALLIVLGRATFGPLYYTGIPVIRLPAWGLGWMGSAYIAFALLTV